MTRRSLLQSLSALPLLGWLIPRAERAPAEKRPRPHTYFQNRHIVFSEFDIWVGAYFFNCTFDGDARWVMVNDCIFYECDPLPIGDDWHVGYCAFHPRPGLPAWSLNGNAVVHNCISR